jgi:hypothetical protein
MLPRALDRLSLGTFNFGTLQLRRDLTHNSPSYLILKSKDIFQISLEVARPHVPSSVSVDQLTCDSYSVRRFPHTAFKHAADAGLASDLFNIYRLAFVTNDIGGKNCCQFARSRQYVRFRFLLV